MKSRLMIGVAAVALAACGNDEAPAAEALTRAQKDSIVAELPVPGAGAVGRAMDARDRANARSGEHDAIR